MGLLRQALETIIIKRCGKKMLLVEMSITADGSNSDLNDPIATALLEMGFEIDDPSNVTDDDIYQVGSDQYNELFDRAERRTLESIAGNLDMVNLQVGSRREEFNQLSEQIFKAIDLLTRKILRRYGDGGSLSAGTLSLDFQEKDE